MCRREDARFSRRSARFSKPAAKTGTSASGKFRGIAKSFLEVNPKTKIANPKSQRSRFLGVGSWDFGFALGRGRNARGRLRIEGIDVALTPCFAGTNEAGFERCKAMYEDFCIVTESVRHGIPVNVHVARCGEELKRCA